MKGMIPIVAIVVLLLVTTGLLGSGWVVFFGYYEILVSKAIRTVPGSSYCEEGSANIYINNVGVSTIKLSASSQLPFDDARNLVENSGFESLDCTNGDCMPESWAVTIPKTSDTVLVTDISSSMRNDCDKRCDTFESGGNSSDNGCTGGESWPVCDDCDDDGHDEDPNEDCKFVNAQKAAKIFLDQMDSNFDNVSLVIFDREALIEIGLINDYDQLKALIDALRTDSGTDIAGGIKNATSVLTQPQSTGDVKVQVLLSDGSPYYCYGESVHGNRTKAIECTQNEADNASLQGIRIYTIGLGVGQTDAEDLLKYIANVTGGRYVNTPDSQDLVEIYISISREITNGVSESNVYGRYSMMLGAGTGRKAESDLIEIVDPSKNYTLRFYLEMTVISGNMSLTIYFYNNIFEQTGEETLQVYNSSIGGFEKQEFDISPGGASYIKISFEWGEDSEGTALMDDMFLGPELTCTSSGKVYTCGDLTITKTSGDGDFYPYLSTESIEPKGMAVLRDANCADGFCEYKIISPSMGIDAGINC